MLLLNHIFSRICCPVEITTRMYVQPGRQPAGCPWPRFSVSSWRWGGGQGCPRDPWVGVAQWTWKGLSCDRRESWVCVGSHSVILLGLGLVITSRTMLCRPALPLNAPQGVRIPQVWESLPARPLLCDPRCAWIRRPRGLQPSSSLLILQASDSQAHSSWSDSQ